MFSYRHAFHAGNHADVLKHLVLIHSIQYLQEKDGALMLIDTHAGAGIYSLRDGYAAISQESQGGIDRLWVNPEFDEPDFKPYREAIVHFNPKGALDLYPGSPFIMAHLLRSQDRLRLFELHPSDIGILETNIASLDKRSQIDIRQHDGFTFLKSLLPPPSRRGLILMDPSYELKSDYRGVESSLHEALDRFATGSYLIWYPVLQRPESKQLIKRLRALSEQFQRPWLRAELRIAHSVGEKRLQSSGVWVINPVWTLAPFLERTLPILQRVLGEEAGATFDLETSSPA
ncbi:MULTISPECIES: 23S rRNA (adenine(2030)-N(6))-methyltransferase RlmJ [unclassified Polynucleobacter]|uniref:23S rRNA (adenine(2030)-N(6))-methyltransferase RlmJ n=1 Tax=unclassified Polynucleobacter TaxID=2640945 RepID=UPI0025741BD8|nr:MULTISPECIES: 23S rRNA (adenine(2030)-N(6))-methyltransferase RlmJ [unclassified Polynucleobacter]BEI42436.1 23S rRNA (adenine(2030)-N(6))-methyltransferase RlmJ [Polynucleobacter sp. HIN10]BEI44189.1 23S rRNA (adenine(2030)-N(6))-methyltransferase RlmJ [Polynucleobacter sp. HIN11]